MLINTNVVEDGIYSPIYKIKVIPDTFKVPEATAEPASYRDHRGLQSLLNPHPDDKMAATDIQTCHSHLRAHGRAKRIQT